MEINLICVGKVKEKFYRDAVTSYAKQLEPYSSLKIIELIDEKTPENASEKEELQIKNKEGDNILTHIKNKAYVIALDIKGDRLTSEQLATKINNIDKDKGCCITFIIGGSLGLSHKVLARADYKFSFSKMTFPHQLFRVMLLEQLYRVVRIN